MAALEDDELPCADIPRTVRYFLSVDDSARHRWLAARRDHREQSAYPPESGHRGRAYGARFKATGGRNAVSGSPALPQRTEVARFLCGATESAKRCKAKYYDK